MSLTPSSIETILQYLDPHLNTLQTGFPTSTRPNEPALTKDQKRQKIEATLVKDPGIFLTKWGSVILYPRPEAPAAASTENFVNGDAVPSSAAKDSLSAKDILDIFAPLAVDYEVNYQLTKLYQQLQRLTEHARFKASRQEHLRSGSTTDVNSANDDMEIEYQDSSSYQSKDIPPEERRPNPGQNDLFTRSIIPQNTRRNRRLNYLLRYLAPPDPSEYSLPSSFTSDAKGKGPAGHATRHSSSSLNVGNSNMNSSGSGGQDPQHRPTLATILSISGSMSNLSFSESTYFSDAEMEARAPELYQQYIGRFMDNDEDDDEIKGDDEDGEFSDTVEEDSDEDKDGGRNGAAGTEDADDEGQGSSRRRRKTPEQKPFDKDVGLVDRILWNIDHPTRKQQLLERQRHVEQNDREESSGTSGSSRQQQQQEGSHGPLTMLPKRNDPESEFEEEFDTESEVDDTEMAGGVDDVDEEDRKGPLRDIADDEIVAKTSVTPPIPPDPIPGFVSSTLASAAMTLEQPEERALFAHVENGFDSHSESSDEEMELDQATINRKEDQEALRQEFVLLMKQRFLDGFDKNFDYSTVDFDENLDDLEQEDHDEEDRWFDEEEEDGEGLDDERKERGASSRATTSTRAVRPMRGGSNAPSRMTFDERVQAWENSAQNGSGEYDY
ncbi:hypothetical protein BGZ58_006086 [Dissophora ornata]|nr:hypothetical protein BGZ58_006086 [Dissophora ornata]